MKENGLKDTPLGLSFINHLRDIIKINGISNNEIESKVKSLNNAENIGKINEESKNILHLRN